MSLAEYGYLPQNFNLSKFGLGVFSDEAWKYTKEEAKDPVRAKERTIPIDVNAFLRVRNSVCVVGYHRDSVNDIKRTVGGLLDEPFPIEGFHVKSPGDVKDGALLVPKIILVARHCAGLKLLDEEGDRGQLDLIYDEVCDMEADVMIIYVGLPRAVYKPMRHMVYHPKMADILFPNQPILRSLAADNSFITVTENSDLTNMQKNVIREWLTKPVNSDHPVYKVAECLSSVELSMGHNGFRNVAPKMQYYKPPSSSMDHDPFDFENDVNFQPATEEHPLADKKKKKKRKDKKDKKSKSMKTRTRDLGTLQEVADDMDSGVEMDTMKYNFNDNPGAYDQFV